MCLYTLETLTDTYVIIPNKYSLSSAVPLRMGLLRM